MAAEALSASTTTWESKRRFDERIRLMLGSSSTISTLPIHSSLSNMADESANVMENVTQPSSFLLTHTSPPWALAIPLTIASPKPVPVGLVVKKGSKIRLQIRSWYCRSGILNIDAEHVFIGRRCQGYCAIFRCCIDCVEGQIQGGPLYPEKHLLEQEARRQHRM